MRAWIDIDYSPQVQYLLPLRPALAERGVAVRVTARDVGATRPLLESSGVPFTVVDAGFGAARWRKVAGTLRRAGRLVRLARRDGVPDFVVATGRSATLAARLLGRPSFAIVDYEHVDATVHRLTRSVIFHPSVIDPESFVRRGIARERLVAFDGLKEDLSFHGLDLHAEPAYQLPPGTEGLLKVLVRPPTEESHYYQSESRELTLRTLEHLARRDDVLVVFSPRHPWQLDDVRRLTWRVDPILLDHPVWFVSLLKAVDAVFAAGGTMIREAAYLGVPAYSLFRGTIGQVDRYLETIGRLHIIASGSDLAAIELRSSAGLRPLEAKPHLVPELVEAMLARAQSAVANGAGAVRPARSRA